ncbi:hypothetical protein MYX84_11800 [Acidobacteria bacterium AH-259-O06]|nr:hypothetical protein [Acidobacteria bacterium AH-259-G07]MDA2930608.1 hypothetical protein [Acidobacteria bacterium AH-259-O06]
MEPFGHRVQKTAKGPVIEDVREPEIDVMKENDHVLVVGDMPGVNEDDIHFEVKGETLKISTEKPRKYEKEIVLPCAINGDQATLSCKNDYPSNEF